ncbi:uncharacterized protein PHALS_12042 [Plasmopara halstedii]|uniref:Uncharacterized protein n=1 Tax=Plasmopara halstedii TaxID=4781 RepID=A0A0P1ALU5_PLAHL|nr:uncharacterized protein PHALS_12042 [Plasmopara halstedii]CEG41711.1 hypothetical protein PHALS_12042 [Plasmopara halstedii]|eukprot:XP_024578080.1 hypothetical protein PHALS_12042 [Plasmopara halstedii]
MVRVEPQFSVQSAHTLLQYLHACQRSETHCAEAMIGVARLSSCRRFINDIKYALNRRDGTCSMLFHQQESIHARDRLSRSTPFHCISCFYRQSSSLVLESPLRRKLRHHVA